MTYAIYIYLVSKMFYLFIYLLVHLFIYLRYGYRIFQNVRNISWNFHNNSIIVNTHGRRQSYILQLHRRHLRKGHGPMKIAIAKCQLS